MERLLDDSQQEVIELIGKKGSSLNQNDKANVEKLQN
jgi:hypothetical protein